LLRFANWHPASFSFDSLMRTAIWKTIGSLATPLLWAQVALSIEVAPPIAPVSAESLEGLPGAMPPPTPQSTMDGVVLRQLGGADFNFDSPSTLTRVPGSPGWMVVGMQRGEFWCVHPATGEKRLFLDLRERLRGVILFEEGVHGIIFHPQFIANGLFYVNYSRLDPRRSVLSEMSVRPGYTKRGPVEADPTTERTLLVLEQPLAEHWGGSMAFGPDDGYLYYGIGDGGIRDDPYRLAQNPWSLHGKMLRLDVNQRSEGRAYGIPKDNPFVHEQTWRPEIWALGLRNPWGLHFDTKTKVLWCADVGQDFWEEINVLEAGGNYGWSDRDGYWPLPAHEGAPAFNKDQKPAYIEPVHAYSRLRGEGLCIIGGYVYRGKKIPKLEGMYLFADWALGRIWALETKLAGGTYVAQHRHLLYERPEGDSVNPTVLVPDFDGEPLVLSQNGIMFQIEMNP